MIQNVSECHVIGEMFVKSERVRTNRVIRPLREKMYKLEYLKNAPTARLIKYYNDLSIDKRNNDNNILFKRIIKRKFDKLYD